jgi:hypothetical protein
MISHKHKCIFIHIPKCGGQSVEDVFIRENGLTWETRSPLLLRRNHNLGIGPPWLAHLTYSEYLEYGYMSKELMDSYFKFTVVRNPFSRMESIYKYRGYNHVLNFSGFIRNVIERQMKEKGPFYYFIRPQFDYLADKDGEIAVNKIIHLEDFEKIKDLFLRLNISINDVPHVNKTAKKGIFNAMKKRIRLAKEGVFGFRMVATGRVVWSQNDIDLVKELYQKDFDSFGYSESWDLIE